MCLVNGKGIISVPNSHFSTDHSETQDQERYPRENHRHTKLGRNQATRERWAKGVFCGEFMFFILLYVCFAFRSRTRNDQQRLKARVRL